MKNPANALIHRELLSSPFSSCDITCNDSNKVPITLLLFSAGAFVPRAYVYADTTRVPAYTTKNDTVVIKMLLLDSVLDSIRKKAYPQ
jgi:hypothetical protein